MPPSAHTHPASDIVSGTMATARLGSGTANGSTFLAGDQTYKAIAAGSGDVVGPASATDNALVRFDATTGKLVQDGTITESDAGALSGITQLDVDNVRVDGNTLSTTNANGDLNAAPNGTGALVVPNGASGAVGLRHAGHAAGTGWVSNGGTQVEWHQNGGAKVAMSNSRLNVANGASLENVSASSTTPNICPALSDADTGLGTAGSNQLSLIAGALEVLRAAAGLGSASGPILFIPNLTTAPSVNPAGGVYMYAESGALKVRGTSGTVTTIAPA